MRVTALMRKQDETFVALFEKLQPLESDLAKSKQTAINADKNGGRVDCLTNAKDPPSYNDRPVHYRDADDHQQRRRGDERSQCWANLCGLRSDWGGGAAAEDDDDTWYDDDTGIMTCGGIKVCRANWCDLDLSRAPRTEQFQRETRSAFALTLLFWFVLGFSNGTRQFGVGTRTSQASEVRPFIVAFLAELQLKRG